MTINQSIEVLKNMLGENDIEDQAIDVAIVVMEKYLNSFEKAV